MVSRLQRHLSLFLVAIIATGWLVVPLERVQGQQIDESALNEEFVDTFGVDPTTGQTVGTVGSGTAGNCPLKLDESQSAWPALYKPAITASELRFDGYRHNCFRTIDDKTIIHAFTIGTSSKLYVQRYSLVDGPALPRTKTPGSVYGGCLNTTANGCNEASPQRFDYFTFFDYGEMGTSRRIADTSTDNQRAKRTTFQSAKMKLFIPADSKNQYAKLVSPGTTPNPNAFLMSDGKNYVYGFYELNVNRLNYYDSRPKLDRVIDRRKVYEQGKESELDYTRKDPASQNTNTSAFVYIAKVNSHSGSFPIEGGVLSSTSNADVDATKKGVLNVFKDTAKSGIDTIKLKNNGDLPPTATVLKGTAPPGKATFKLTNFSWQSSGTIKNNYFFFQLQRDGSTTPAIITAIGGDPSKVYLAVDLAGNVAFVVDDPAKNGGVFAVADGNTIDSFVILGAFDSSDSNRSNLGRAPTPPGPVHVNFEEYLSTITQYVYNDPNPDGLPTKCKGNGTSDSGISELILYPEKNNYQNDDRFPLGLIKPDWRQCINMDKAAGTGTGTSVGDHPSGWLVKWGVNMNKLDAPADTDECSSAFRGGFINELAGKMLCGVISGVINLATWAAGFSIEFLIQAMGLQSQ